VKLPRSTAGAAAAPPRKLLVFPDPRPPEFPFPQHLTMPVLATMHVDHPLVATFLAVIPAPRGTKSAGTLALANWSVNPSCPSPFIPQHLMDETLHRAHVAWLPTDIWTTEALVDFMSKNGKKSPISLAASPLLPEASPYPSPWKYPQHFILRSAVKMQQCNIPHEIRVAVTPVPSCTSVGTFTLAAVEPNPSTYAIPAT
jgi:hypothetical protein